MIELSAGDVFDRFSMLSGADDAERFLPLCADAAAEVCAGERDSCGEEARPALNAAAAALAFYRYALLRAGLGSGSFSAGDVKVEEKGDLSAAREFWRQAAANAAPYCRDGGSFLFGRIGP